MVGCQMVDGRLLGLAGLPSTSGRPALGLLHSLPISSVPELFALSPSDILQIPLGSFCDTCVIAEDRYSLPARRAYMPISLDAALSLLLMAAWALVGDVSIGPMTSSRSSPRSSS